MHLSKNTPKEHLDSFYKTFDDISSHKYDGLIITGAPIEHLEFEQVDYWEEMVRIMNWADRHVTSTIVYLLGITGRTISPLRNSQVHDERKDVRGLQAQDL